MAKRLIQRLEKFAKKHKNDTEPNGLPRTQPIPFTIGDGQILILPAEAMLIADAIQKEYISRTTHNVVRKKLDRATEIERKIARFAEIKNIPYSKDDNILEWLAYNFDVRPRYNDTGEPTQYGDYVRITYPSGEHVDGTLQAIHYNSGSILILSFVGCNHERLIRFDPEHDTIHKLKDSTKPVGYDKCRIHMHDCVVHVNEDGEPDSDEGYVSAIEDDSRIVVAEKKDEKIILKSYPACELIHVTKHIGNIKKPIKGDTVYYTRDDETERYGHDGIVVDITSAKEYFVKWWDEPGADTNVTYQESELSLVPVTPKPGDRIWCKTENDPSVYGQEGKVIRCDHDDIFVQWENDNEVEMSCTKDEISMRPIIANKDANGEETNIQDRVYVADIDKTHPFYNICGTITRIRDGKFFVAFDGSIGGNAYDACQLSHELMGNKTHDYHDETVAVNSIVYSLVPSNLGKRGTVVDVNGDGSMTVWFEDDTHKMIKFEPEEVSVRPLARLRNGKLAFPQMRVWHVDETNPDHYGTIISLINSRNIKISSHTPEYTYNGIWEADHYTSDEPACIDTLIKEMNRVADSRSEYDSNTRIMARDWAATLERIAANS